MIWIDHFMQVLSSAKEIRFIRSPGEIDGKFVKTESTVTLRSGEEGHLLCTFKASPNGARILWNRGEQQIVNVLECGDHRLSSCNVCIGRRHKYDVSGNLTSGVTLHIKNVTLDDQGDYECKVTSREGLSFSTIHFSVMGEYKSCNLVS